MARLKAERDGLRQQRNNVRLLAPTDGVITAHSLTHRAFRSLA
jgi:hypothetical protein